MQLPLTEQFLLSPLGLTVFGNCEQFQGWRTGRSSSSFSDENLWGVPHPANTRFLLAETVGALKIGLGRPVPPEIPP